MGGPGSGRSWHIGAKDTTSDYRAIDIRRWHREGLIDSPQCFGWQWFCNEKLIASIRVKSDRACVTLIYRHQMSNGDWQDKDYPVYLSWSNCNYGGLRPWFLCPAEGCGRRVAILFGGSVFACRHCHGLAYPSQRETHGDRAARKANRIRQKLGWVLGILNPKGWEKPKGMHWRTFERLNNEHDALVQITFAGIVKELNWETEPRR